ncbi:O-antigen ligase family protein [Clostridium sp. AL.422]|uniref:O-antigen ligase family protein n=1 Tax=Clostridium TaxID=1485 RepID=UPI00293DB854|nr:MULTISPECIES: O-antigen ligase family protein [unclassified Clostridium]MDV4152775.1 O-antigen ligase family protein [Clostridium sp. AL.422]
MKFYKDLNYILLLIFVILYPILPTYGKYSSDIIIYSLILVNTLCFLLIKEYRLKVINIIKSIYKDKLFISLILLNLSMYASTFVAINKRVAFTNSIRFSLYLFIFYLISYTVENKKNITVITNSFIITAIFSSIISIYQIIKLISIGESLTNTNNRISSFLENSNNLGAYSLLALFIVLMLIINSKKKTHKLIYTFSSILLLINIVFSQSRNSLIGLIIGIVIIAVLYDKRFIIASFVFPILLLVIPQSRVRILQIFDFTQNSSRFKIWETTRLMIHDNPLLGIGYENFQYQYPIYVNRDPSSLLVSENYIALHPHNVFLKFQVELGILGSIFFLLFLLFTIYTTIKLIRRCNNKYISNLSIGIIAGFISINFMNLIDNFYSAPKVLITMLVILGIENYYINTILKNNKKQG